MRLRQAARAVLLDPDDRILLVRFQFPDVAVWGTPGGGVDPDETHEQAIVRELAEEAGLEEVVLGPWIWTRKHVIPFLDGKWDGQVERFVLVRTARFEPAPRFTPEQLAAEYVTARPLVDAGGAGGVSTSAVRAEAAPRAGGRAAARRPARGADRRRRLAVRGLDVRRQHDVPAVRCSPVLARSPPERAPSRDARARRATPAPRARSAPRPRCRETSPISHSSSEPMRRIPGRASWPTRCCPRRSPRRAARRPAARRRRP